MYRCIDSDDADELLKHLGAPHFDGEGHWVEYEEVSEEESYEFWTGDKKISRDKTGDKKAPTG